ncbi:glycosyltransferase family 2 protein [Rhizobium halophytocola]|uniref:Glycosyltransferase involved in cell wall biosynthesis n=1 Tax=Rhizobium halophytocola TaxID=735519 RepID=A0ABS4DUS9_9HYPH|nr:hypothetical protein [Rhizobium halophytocola]MBP1849379.1 glycosyltransferase involved in cell wall biosynthesis [Rhizobium halophytocola]
MKKVLIATPCFGGQVYINYMQSVLKIVLQCRDRGYAVHVHQATDALVTRARNNIVAVFLDGDWDYLFWIDADIGFDPGQFFRLLDIDRDIAAAAYPLKRYHFPVEPAGLAGRDLETSMLRYAINLPDGVVTVPTDGFVEVRDAATGFMCIRRGVLDDMRRAYPDLHYRSDQDLLGGPASTNHYLFFDTLLEGDRYLSEDYAFCRRAQRAGYRIWLDMCSALRHMGPHEFRGSIPETSRAAQRRSSPGR